MKWREETSRGPRARLHLLRVVDPPAPPVLALHGLGVGGSIWQGFARRLLPQLAVVAPDLRGHGDSDAPPSGYLPSDYARDLIELLQNEDWLEPPVPVIGHSLGALVGLALADLRPDLVRWLVLLDPPIDPELRNPEIPSVYRLRHAGPGELEAYLLSRNPGGGQVLADSLARLFRQASDAAFEALFNPADPAGGHAPSLLFSGRAGAFDRAPRILQPCLVLQADPGCGGVLGDAAARSFVASLPRGQLHKIGGAAHALHASHPAEVARAILEFYSSEGVSGSR
ncbi:MAG: alpha/beta hydrolase [Chloroflexota bacterium]|nr:alpha/beta hydrolase [Chloroflexota bacterium]